MTLALALSGVAGATSSAPGAGGSTAHPVASGCLSPAAPGTRAVVLSVGGRQRHMLVHVPPRVARGRHLALLVVLHGFSSNGAKMERYTGFSALADRAKFIVAYPSAAGGRWAIYAGEPRAHSDMEFVRAAIAQVSSTLCVDRSRRFVVGVSNGAGEVARLACQLGDRLAGVAMVAGDYRSLPACHPPRPVSVLEIHGTKDPVVPYLGRAGDGSGGVPAFLRLWRRLDHCPPTGVHRRRGVRVSLSWRCVGHTRVAHLKIIGLGHAWPGAYPARGHVPRADSATQVIWRFFDSLRMRGHF